MSKTTDAPLKVLYIVYWGAAEPLGQSLVLPAVKKLARMGVQLTLVTFEKPVDLVKQPLIEEVRTSLESLGVQWVPLRYHQQPKVALDFVQGLLRAFVIGLRLRPDIVHARTFVAGLVGLFLAPMLRAKLIFHNEGFFPDEQVDGGVWKKDSAIHRICKFFEHQMYARADGIIALSQRAKRDIENFRTVTHKNTPVIVVPSCVDLQHFQPANSPPVGTENELRLVYVGSVGRRHLMDKIGRFVAVAVQEIGNVHLRVLSQTEKSVVTSMLEAGGLSESHWSYSFVPHAEIPDQIKHQHAGLLFYPQGLSEHGGSPTKVGEYWASGLPVITTPNVSDTDEIIRREKVGTIIRNHTDGAYRQAAQELLQLLRDGELSSRCRRAAETYYALHPACEKQVDLYRDLAYGTANEFIQASASEASDI